MGPPPPDTWARWFDSLAPSNIDWCEANYAISPYVAEFWNAMSSVPMTLVAFYGLYMARRHMRFEPRWGMAWFLLGIVGVGGIGYLFRSALAHGAMGRAATFLLTTVVLTVAIDRLSRRIQRGPRC